MAKKKKTNTPINKSGGIDVVFSFDTTGSMYPCITQVREELKDNVVKLFKEIPNIRIGIIAHGDYCDAGSTYVTSILDLSDNVDTVCNFIKNVKNTWGGDAPECYELVLNQARTKISWKTGRSKVLALIGDDVPHGPHEYQNTKKIDWRNELGLLLEADVKVYGVQALNRLHATSFYKEIAERTGGFHLTLDQFSEVSNLILAICYKQDGDETLKKFEEEIIKQKKMTRSMDETFSTLLKRAPSGRFVKRGLDVVEPGRFQVMNVPSDCSIRDFVQNRGIPFVKGRGFYEFTKPEDIQGYKEIILMDRETGDTFCGATARKLLGLPPTGNVHIRPDKSIKYRPFVQSTSVNRKLIAGTKFLYEVDSTK